MNKQTDNKSGFCVPENYFKELEDNIINKNVFSNKSKSFIFIKIMSVAASILIVVGTGFILWNLNQTKSISKEDKIMLENQIFYIYDSPRDDHSYVTGILLPEDYLNIYD